MLLEEVKTRILSEVASWASKIGELVDSLLDEGLSKTEWKALKALTLKQTDGYSFASIQKSAETSLQDGL